MDGTDLEARIKNFDRFAVIVEQDGATTWSSSTPSRPSARRARRRASAPRAGRPARPASTPMSTSPFRRVIVIVLDSVGVGELPDAAVYGDEGSNTLGNIAARSPLRDPEPPRARRLAASCRWPGWRPPARRCARSAAWPSVSPGKDSVTGHWELMGLVLDSRSRRFPHGFPATCIARVRAPHRPAHARQRRGVRHADHRGARAGAHADRLADRLHVGRQRVPDRRARGRHPRARAVPDLRDRVRRSLVEGMGLGRVIARPFVGVAGARSRGRPTGTTTRSRPSATRCSTVLTAAGVPVVAIGKIEDLFAGRGITARGPHRDRTTRAWTRSSARWPTLGRGLIFANLVDFDAHVRPPQRRRRATPRTSSGSTSGSGGCCRCCATATCSSSPPTTATTRRRRARITRASTCRCSRPARACRPGVDLGDRGRPSRTSARRSPSVFGVGAAAHGTSFLRDLRCAGR